MAADHRLGNGSAFVPLSLYLEDRTEMKNLLRELTTEVREMRREMDRDDGAEVAEEAAAVAVKEARKTRAERAWDVTRTVIASALGVAATLLTTRLF